MSATAMPGSPAWQHLVTASKVAAIVGASPWDSPWSLWHKMTGRAPWDATTDAMERGNLLEPAVLAWWRTRHPDATGVVEQPWHGIGDWAGARPDLAVSDDGHGNPAVVEAKTTADDRDWGNPGTDEIPAHYAAQVQWQMGCAGAQIAYVPMLGPRLVFAEYVVPFDPAVFAWLVDEAREFHASLDRDEPPPLDTSVATLTTLRRMHPDIDPDAVVVVPDEQIDALAAARAAKRAAENAERAALVPVLAAMGTAATADTPTRTRAAIRQASGRGVALKLTGDAA